MKLPAGDVFLLDRALPEPDAREFFTLDGGDGEPAVVFFTSQELAEAYLEACAEEGWELSAASREALLGLLAESFRVGMTRAFIDPTPEGPGEAVPVFRVLADSGPAPRRRRP